MRRVGPSRLVLTLIVLAAALAMASDAWHLLLVRDWERALYNLRIAATAPPVVQDPRIVEIVYTDDTLAALGKRSPLDRSILAKALTNIDRFGAKAIGIDILIDQKQPEDGQLIAAFRRMHTPTYLGYTTAAANPDQMMDWQQAFMDQFFAQLAPGNVHKAAIQFVGDGDNVMRSWPLLGPSLPPLLANAMIPQLAFPRDYSGSLLYYLPVNKDRPVFEQLPIDLFVDPAMSMMLRNQIAGKYVLIGGKIQDIDLWDTPITRFTGHPGIGLDIHAAMLAQLLDRKQLKPLPGWSLLLFALLVVAMGALSSAVDLRLWQVALVALVQLLLIGGVPFLLQDIGVDTQTVPAAGWIFGWAMAYFAVGSAARGVSSDQRRYAQSALGRYLPRDVARQILRDPEQLRLTGEKREIIALFTDLEGFTKLSHAISPEMVATLLNKYLDQMCAIVLAHGGTIDKFVGDAIVAFWGAPVSRPDDADRAIQAAMAMYDAGEHFRVESLPGGPSIGRTRIGLDRGAAVVGNFGGEGRIQYTALGDVMNTASRLEGANKYLHTVALVSRNVVTSATSDLMRPMGRITVSGRSTPLEIFEPAPQMTAEDRRKLGDLYRRFDGGEIEALDELAAFVAARPEDAPLVNMLKRLEEAGPGGSYVLESK